MLQVNNLVVNYSLIVGKHANIEILKVLLLSEESLQEILNTNFTKIIKIPSRYWLLREIIW